MSFFISFSFYVYLFLYLYFPITVSLYICIYFLFTDITNLICYISSYIIYFFFICISLFILFIYYFTYADITYQTLLIHTSNSLRSYRKVVSLKGDNNTLLWLYISIMVDERISATYICSKNADFGYFMK